MGWLTTAWRSVARAFTGSATPGRRSGGGWGPVVREPYAGAWQKNDELRADSVLSYWAVFACITLIASDIGKLALMLVARDDAGIWKETNSPSFSPVLRKPNRYQTIHKFIEQWMISKLAQGNTYVLKQRDGRRVVVGMHVLDPSCVTPLVATDGSVYYQLQRDDLAGLSDRIDLDVSGGIVVPASEIIHDLMIPLFHPLCGVSPIYACGAAALQGLNIQANSSRFFGNLSRPGGILTAPAAINDDTAARLKADWETNFGGDNFGRVAVVGDGLKYENMAVNAVDAQLIEQLQWTEAPICACYHVPVFMIDSTKTPPYANSEPLTQQYYSQCLQSLITNCETCLDEGLELPDPFGTQFDIDDLIWMDTATKTKAANDSIGSGALSPDEARLKYFGLGTVVGGDTPYMQQQYFSLKALAQRDADQPFAKAAPAAPATPAAAPDDPAAVTTAAYQSALWRKCAAEFSSHANA